MLSLDEKLILLTERERRDYEIYMRLKQPPMSASAQAQFFQLFLNGQTCEDIHRLNPNGFSLGAIVRARIENDWDELRQQHVRDLLTRVKDRVVQVQADTAMRVANELAASNKKMNDKLLRYLQTGEEAELEGTGVGTLKHLEKSVELLLKLTGQGDGQPKETKKEVSGTVTHQHVIQQAPGAAPVPALPPGPVRPAQAAQALRAIHANRQQSEGEE